MDLGEIETFLALAEELHFGRTAQRLRLSQSRVSQQIQSLERRLGAPLFTRTSRRVELTRLGEHTRDSLGAAYQALGNAFDEARTVAQGVVGTLRIGFLGCLNGAPLTTLAADFAAAHPACRISLAEVPWTDLYGQLRGGELDLVLSLLPVAEPDLRFGPPLVGHDRVLAVAVDHPLAADAAVDAERLADHPVLALPSQLPTALRLSAQPPVTPQGRPILPAGAARTYQEALNQVATGRLVWPTHAGLFRHYCHPGVTSRPLTGLPPAHGALVWRAAAEDARIRAFVALGAAHNIR